MKNFSEKVITAFDVDASTRQRLKFIENPLLVNAAVVVSSNPSSRPISTEGRIKKMGFFKTKKDSSDL